MWASVCFASYRKTITFNSICFIFLFLFLLLKDVLPNGSYLSISRWINFLRFSTTTSRFPSSTWRVPLHLALAHWNRSRTNKFCWFRVRDLVVFGIFSLVRKSSVIFPFRYAILFVYFIRNVFLLRAILSFHSMIVFNFHQFFVR